MTKAHQNDPIMERVIGLMHDQRLRWNDIGNALGLSPQRLYNWRSKGRVPQEQLPALAELFGCTLDYLVRGVQDEATRYQSPPKASEWLALPLRARAFVTTTIHLILLGSLTLEDVDFLSTMTTRMASKGHPDPSQGGTGAPGGWLFGGPAEDAAGQTRDARNEHSNKQRGGG